MNINENLITEARRYCIENFDYWFQRYSNERKGNSFPYNYTKHDYNLFPRYLILSKIREEVETVIEEEFDSIADCKTKLIDLSYSCDTNSKSKNKVESKAIQDEKDKFSKFINSLNEEDLYYVEPLPYRRKLTDIQSTEYRVRLLERWKFDGGYWIPLTDDCPEDSIWFSTENLTTKDISQIREFLLTNYTGHYFEITEDEIDYEIENSEMDFECCETLYSDETLNWCVYGSHESTIAFAGRDLLKFINELFKDRVELKNSW